MQVVCTKKRGCKTSKSWMISRELSKYSKLRGHSGPLYLGTYLFKANFTCRKGWRNVKSWVETFWWCLFLETFSWISFGPNLWQASGDKRKTLIHLNFLMDSPHTHCQFWGFSFTFLVWICNILLLWGNLWNYNAYLFVNFFVKSQHSFLDFCYLFVGIKSLNGESLEMNAVISRKKPLK